MILPSEEAFKNWWHDPLTVLLRELLEKKREELRQQWEGGSFTDYAAETTALINVGNLGTCKGYAYVTGLTYEQLKGEVEDGTE